MPYAPGIEATRIPSLVPAAFPHRDAKIRSRLKFIAIRKRQIRDRSLDLACRLSHSALRRALHASIALQEAAVFLAIIFNEKSIDCDLDAVSLRGGRVSAKPVFKAHLEFWESPRDEPEKQIQTASENRLSGTRPDFCSPGTREIRTLARFSKRKTKPFSMFDFIKRLFPRKGRSRFVDLSGKACSDEEYNRIRQQQQAEAMRILHKISTKGEKSLHPEEKEFLKRFSQSNYNR